jgi:hypothetical protein
MTDDETCTRANIADACCRAGSRASRQRIAAAIR